MNSTSSGDGGTLGVTLVPEIEGSYAEIGQALVEFAMRQLTSEPSQEPRGLSERSPAVSTRAQVQLWVEAEGGTSSPTDRPPIVCCVCVRENWPDAVPEGEVIICRGPCCPGF
jgi:hypothetical protein